MYIHLVGKHCPSKTQDDYILPVKLLIEGLRRDDHPPIPQLSLPISVPNDCCARGLLSKSLYIQATGYLILIGFYYLLRCGEYTAPRYAQSCDGTLKRSTRTKQFMVGDVGFWKGISQLPSNSPLHIILQTDSSTLKIKNQKNGRMGQTIHPNLFASNICPYKAPACRIHHILTNSGSKESYICEYRVTCRDPFATVTPADLIIAIRFSVSALKLLQSYRV